MSENEMESILRDIQRRCEQALTTRDKTIRDREFYRQILANIALDTAEFVIIR